VKKLILSAALLISGTVAQAMESSDIAAEKPAVAAETSLTQEAVAVAEPRVETKLVVEAKPVAAEEKVEIKAEPLFSHPCLLVFQTLLKQRLPIAQITLQVTQKQPLHFPQQPALFF
jgi:hypothetical protein